MIPRQEYAANAQHITQWIQDFFQQIEGLPVKSQVKPGDIIKQLPADMPDKGEPLGTLIEDLDRIILPGITHWQHPNFHAFFPANSSVESLLAEQITAAIGAQCMVWETSPAAAELEERMCEWLRNAMNLPKQWEGVIQDTASGATLAAIITAREKVTHFIANEEGVPAGLRVYCSNQTHSSIEKAVTLAGLGRKNLVKIATDDAACMIPEALEQAILKDLRNGLTPCCIVGTIGTTGTLGMDDHSKIGPIAQKYGIWLHVDAAYAGTALLLPELQHLGAGMEYADSFVFNPHKWMFTNFDCSIYFIKEPELLIRSMEILPEYLKNATRGLVNDYRDWGVPLGRRFRALKLWFVMRMLGLEGIQARLRSHLELCQNFADFIQQHEQLELCFGPILNTCGFALNASNFTSLEACNAQTKSLMEAVNARGTAYLSHTVYKNRYIIRAVFGQTYLDSRHVKVLMEVVNKELQALTRI